MKNSSQESKTRQVPNLICLTGIDGSGKSTHLRRLSKWLEEKHNLKSSPLSVWEIAKNPTYHKHPFISDRNAVHKYLGMLHPTARALFIFHGLFESFDLTKDSIAPIVIADGYWYKYAFTENLQGQDLDWLLAICGRFPKPKLTILLDLDPVDAWQRKPNITPYECGFLPPSKENFVEFQGRLRKAFLVNAKKENWKSIQANRPENDIASDIIEIIEKEVEKWTLQPST